MKVFTRLKKELVTEVFVLGSTVPESPSHPDTSQGSRVLSWGAQQTWGTRVCQHTLRAGFWSVKKAFFRQYPRRTNDTPGTWRCIDQRVQGCRGKKTRAPLPLCLQWSPDLGLLHHQPWSSFSGCPQSQPPLSKVVALPVICAWSCRRLPCPFSYPQILVLPAPPCEADFFQSSVSFENLISTGSLYLLVLIQVGSLIVFA